MQRCTLYPCPCKPCQSLRTPRPRVDYQVAGDRAWRPHVDAASTTTMYPPPRRLSSAHDFFFHIPSRAHPSSAIPFDFRLPVRVVVIALYDPTTCLCFLFPSSSSSSCGLMHLPLPSEVFSAPSLAPNCGSSLSLETPATHRVILADSHCPMLKCPTSILTASS